MNEITTKSPPNLYQVSVIIPVKDEESNLAQLIESVKREMCAVKCQVIVVDDGSTDKTREISEKCGVIVISHVKNKGKGAAMKTGAFAAEGKILVFIDGDGAHNPSDILNLIGPLQTNATEIVIGSRHLPGSVIPGAPLRRRLSNTLASQVISITAFIFLPAALWINRLVIRHGKSSESRTNRIEKHSSNKWLTDCTSGFRAMTKATWQTLPLVSDGFEIETEMIFEAVKHGIRITEIPITCNWDSRSSKLSIVRDGVKTLRLLLNKLLSSAARG